MDQGAQILAQRFRAHGSIRKGGAKPGAWTRSRKSNACDGGVPGRSGILQGVLRGPCDPHDYSAIVNNEAFPPAAVVLIVTVRSVAKRNK